MNRHLNEVSSFLTKWFSCVHDKVSIEEQGKLFNHEHPRIFAPDGRSFTLKDHNELHERWTNEVHQLGPLEIVPLDSEAHRLKVNGSVYWEARRKDNQQLIKAVVVELWFLARNNTNDLQFSFYHSTLFHLLPGSAEISLD